MKKLFSIVALKQPNSEERIFALYKYLRRLLTRTVSPKFLSNNLCYDFLMTCYSLSHFNLLESHTAQFHIGFKK